MKAHLNIDVKLRFLAATLVVAPWLCSCSSTSSSPAAGSDEVFKSRGVDAQDPFASEEDYLKNGVRPQRIAGAAAIYPKSLLGSHIGGEVVVDYIVTAEGKVAGAYALQGARQELAESAVRAVRAWQFKPGTLRGRKVAVRMQQPFTFVEP